MVGDDAAFGLHVLSPDSAQSGRAPCLQNLDIVARHEEDDGLNLARPLKAGAEQEPVCIVGAARESPSAAQLVTVAGQYCFSGLHVAARHEGARVRIPDIRLRLCWEEREMESEEAHHAGEPAGDRKSTRLNSSH